MVNRKAGALLFLSMLACDRGSASSKSQQQQQEEAFGKAYVTVTQQRPETMKALGDLIGSRPAQCMLDGAGCNCLWRFLTPTKTREIKATGAPPLPMSFYKIRLKNVRTGEVEPFDDMKLVADALVSKRYALIDDEKYYVHRNIAKYGSDLPNTWMTGAQLRPQVFGEWYLATPDSVAFDTAKERLSKLDAPALLDTCTRSDVTLYAVQFDDESPLIFRTTP